MKNLLLIFTFVLVSTSAFSQLNRYAEAIKDFDSDGYEIIKKYAIKEWGSDHEMVVYRINNQSKAIYDIMSKFQSEHTNILYRSIQMWSYDGYLKKNQGIFENETTVIELAQMLKFYVDWEMVEYEYDNQVDAKGSY